MASIIYPEALLGLLTGAIDLDTDDIRAIGVTSSYTYSSAHNYLDDLTNTVGTAVALTGEAVSRSSNVVKFDSSDPTQSAVAAGSTIDRLVIYKHTGTAGTSNLIALLELDTPQVTNGGDITYTLNAGGIFDITATGAA